MVGGSCIAMPFGWSWEFVSRVIVFRGGLRAGDKLVLVVARPRGDYEAKRVREAVYSVERFIDSIGMDSTECVRLCEIDVYDRSFLEIVGDVSSCIARELRSCRALEVYLLGGMRILLLATLYSIAVLRSMVSLEVVAYSGPEDGSTIVEIPQSLLKSESYYTENQLQLLAKLLELGEATLENLVQVDKSIDSVRKTIDRLVKKGVVEKSSRGRKPVYRLTELGKALARTYRVLVYGERGT